MDNNLDANRMKQILRKQRRLFDSGKTRDIQYRINKLKTLRKAIKVHEAEIIHSLYQDLRKPEFEAYATEIGYVLESISHMIKNLKSWAKPIKVKMPIHQLGSKGTVYYEPYGMVLIIGPFNYPFQLVIEPLIGAIAAGNTAVLKPSEYTPHTSRTIEKMIKEIFDEGYVTTIQGEKEVTSKLIQFRFDYIFFTGSVSVGKIIMETASKNLTPITLELGGKSPAIVYKDADLEIAAKRIIWGKMLNAGQTCIAPDYVLVHEKMKKKLVQKMTQYIEDFYSKNPRQSNSYGRIINERHFNRLISLLDESRIIYGGMYDKKDLYVSPTLVNEPALDDPIMREEIFGPILPLIAFQKVNEAIEIVRKMEKPLALYIFSQRKDVQDKFIHDLSFGGGCINDTLSHIISPYMPFGGVGPSGLGAYHGKESFLTFSHKKSIVKKSTQLDMDIIYPPYKERAKLLRYIQK